MPTLDDTGGYVYLGTASGITVSTSATYSVWTTGSTTTFATMSSAGPFAVNYVNYNAPEDTPEETERRRQAREARQRDVAERGRLRLEAIERASALLLAVLDEAQREDYRATECFNVTGSRGTRYRIHPGSVGNVEWFTSDGASGGRLCAHPNMAEHWLPDQDVAVAQMLALTTDEAAFVRLANVHVGRRPELVAV